MGLMKKFFCSYLKPHNVKPRNGAAHEPPAGGH